MPCGWRRARSVRLFTIRPAHNPIGPFDFAGGFDDRSDRSQPLDEMMSQGYEDAYRQFIEPVVGASGEQRRAEALTAARRRRCRRDGLERDFALRRLALGFRLLTLAFLSRAGTARPALAARRRCRRVRESPNFSWKRAQRDDGLGHRAMAAGAADVGEEPPHELARVLRVAEVPHRNHQRVVDDAGDHGPLDVLDLQEEVGDVGDEVLARRGAEERAEHLVRRACRPGAPSSRSRAARA